MNKNTFCKKLRYLIEEKDMFYDVYEIWIDALVEEVVEGEFDYYKEEYGEKVNWCLDIDFNEDKFYNCLCNYIINEARSVYGSLAHFETEDDIWFFFENSLDWNDDKMFQVVLDCIYEAIKVYDKCKE